MNNRTDDTCQAAGSERPILEGTDQTAGKPSEPCPKGTPWCQRHDEDTCWSRSFLVGDTHLDVARGSTGLALYGLDDFQNAPDLQTARQIADAILTLIAEVER